VSAKRPPALIVVGASAGGIEALTALVRGLDPRMPAAICVVVHIPSFSYSVLPNILRRAGQLPAVHAEHGMPLEAGCIYVAPPDHHLLVVDGRLHLSRQPRENSHRPAIDPLFRSAARAFGRRAAGVVLSGALDDGTLGLVRLKQRGAVALVQDPRDAAFESMPRSALEYVDADYVLPANELGPALVQLAHELAERPPEGGIAMAQEAARSDAARIADDKAAHERGERSGDSTLFTCPDCGGVLWEFSENGPLRFRCHVGHTYSAESIEAGLADSLESALWTALRSVEESASLSRRLAHRARLANNERSAEHFDQRAQHSQRQAHVIRQAITSLEAPQPASDESAAEGELTGA
jgi:two-component system, chemotaxis family, protein-glutamate methylesterase/glutaminase